MLWESISQGLNRVGKTSNRFLMYGLLHSHGINKLFIQGIERRDTVNHIRTQKLQDRGRVPISEELREVVVYEKKMLGDSLGEKIDWYFDEDNQVAIMTSRDLEEYTFVRTLENKENITIPAEIRDIFDELTKGEPVLQYCRDPENNSAYVMTEEVFFKLVDEKNGLIN